MTTQTPRDVWDGLTPDQRYDAYQRLWAALDTAERERDAREAALQAIADVCARTRRAGENYVGSLSEIEVITKGETP